jgi:hypothetical protein
MTKVHQLRIKADETLDRLEARALALEANINLTNDQISERIQRLKDHSSTTANAIQAKVGDIQGIASDQKAKITDSLEQLKLQLSLGRLEAKSTAAEQKKLIENAAIVVSAHIRANADHLDAEIDKDLDAWAQALIELDAEFEAAEMAWDAEWRAAKAANDAHFEAKKQKITDDIAKFKSELTGRRDAAQDKLESFHDEMSEAFSQVRSAFQNLAS